MFRLRAWVSSVVIALVAGCGGGGGAEPTPIQVQPPPVVEAPPPPIVVAQEPLSIQFGANNRIDLVAGAASVIVPITASGSIEGLALKLIDGPSFARVEGMSLRVDVAAHPQLAKTYAVTLALVDATQQERGRQIGSVDVSAVSVASPIIPLANGQTIAAEGVGLTLSAPIDAFSSGSAQVKVERIIDTDGQPAIRVTTSESINAPLSLTASVSSRSSIAATRVRRQDGNSRTPETARRCSDDPSRGHYSWSVSNECTLVWSQPSSLVTCGSGTANSTLPTAQTPVRVLPDQVAATQLLCPGTSSVVINKDIVWSKLSGPTGWEQWGSEEWKTRVPILLIHGFTLDGIGGSPETWAATGNLLETLVLPGNKRPAVFEFQWRTDTSFTPVSVEFTSAINHIYSQGNQAVTVIAHSFGGLVARVALQDLIHSKFENKLDRKVDRLITIGTPHSGVVTAAGASLIGLPDGSDSPLNFNCGQRSCYEAGTNTGLFGDYPAQVILDLKDLIGRPLPSNLSVHVLVGLRRTFYPDQSSVLLRGQFGQRPGDGLISYRGQRFKVDDALADRPPRVFGQDGLKIEERVLGLDGDIPDFARRSASATGIPDIRHANSIFTGISADFAEAYIELGKENNHPTWKELTRILNGTSTVLSAPLTKPPAPRPLGYGAISGPGPVAPSEKISLSWQIPPATTVDGYRVIVKDEADSSTTDVVIEGNSTSVAVSLRPGGRYSWKVLARNLAGWSLESQPLYFQVLASGSADLTVKGIQFSPGSVSPGADVAVSWTIRNQGDGAAAASNTVVRINQSRISSDPINNLANVRTGTIAAGQSSSQYATVTAPTALGTYNVWILADHNGTAGQGSATENDIVLAAGTLTVALPNAAPTISSVSPNPVTGSDDPQTVTIYGTGFVNKPTLTLGWTGRSGYTVPASQVTFVSDTQVRMSITTTAAPDNWTVKAINPDGKISNTLGFTVVKPANTAPSLNGVLPISYPASSSNQTMTINGANFLSGATLLFVSPSGVSYPSVASRLTFSSASQLSYQFNNGNEVGNWNVTVINPNSQRSNPVSFAVTAVALAPSLNGVLPISYPASSSNQTMTINGANFLSGATLLFVSPSGVSYPSVASRLTFSSASQLSYQFNNGNEVGNWNVTVINPNSQRSNPVSFAVR